MGYGLKSWCLRRIMSATLCLITKNKNQNVLTHSNSSSKLYSKMYVQNSAIEITFNHIGTHIVQGLYFIVMTCYKCYTHHHVKQSV